VTLGAPHGNGTDFACGESLQENRFGSNDWYEIWYEIQMTARLSHLGLENDLGAGRIVVKRRLVLGGG
jgi:hypothetical protein